MLLALLSIVAGMLAATAVVIKKLPDAENVIKKIKPYEAMIGAAALLFGLFSIFSVSYEFKRSFLQGSSFLASAGACIIMGFLLGYPVLQDMIFDEMSEDARKKSAELYEKLTPYKVTAGLIGLGAGALLLILVVF